MQYSLFLPPGAQELVAVFVSLASKKWRCCSSIWLLVQFGFSFVLYSLSYISIAKNNGKSKLNQKSNWTTTKIRKQTRAKMPTSSDQNEWKKTHKKRWITHVPSQQYVYSLLLYLQSESVVQREALQPLYLPTLHLFSQQAAVGIISTALPKTV